MKTWVGSFIVGLILGLLFVLLVHTIPQQPARQAIALFLAFTACVYAGALLAQSAPGLSVGLELIVAAVVFVCAAVGLRASTGWLAAGYVLHGVWDLFHRPSAVPTRVASWFPPLCAAFDFVVAIALLIGPWRPMA
jgi:hypothetical protein